MLKETIIVFVLITNPIMGTEDLIDWDAIFNEECKNDCLESVKSNGCCPSTVCRSNEIGTSIYYSSVEYEVIQNCPSTVTDDVRDLCQDIDTDVTSDFINLLPVTSETTTFSNKHCASCYNVSNYEVWAVNISCASYVNLQNLRTQQEIINMALSSIYCNVILTPPNRVQPEMCSLFDFGPSFKGERVQLEGDRISYFDGRQGHHGRVPTRIQKAPLSIILNFNDMTEVSADVLEHDGDNQTCSATQWSHNLTDICHDIHCFQGKQLSGDRCVSLIQDGRGMVYMYPLRIRSLSTFTQYNCDLLESTKELMFSIADQLQIESFMCNMSSQFLVLKDGTTVKSEATRRPTYLEIYFSFQLIVTHTISRDRFEELALELLNKTWTMSCGDSVIELTVTGQNRPAKENASSLQTQMHDNIELDYISYVGDKDTVITITPRLVCRFVTFNHSQYERKGSTVTIQVDQDPELLRLSDTEYDIADGGMLHVCVDVLGDKYDSLILERLTTTEDVENIHHDIQIYLSYVCITLSLIGLLITFIIYMVFPSLRSLPAKNNICLVFNLFWAQLLLQYGIKLTDNHALCQTLGILIHFFWLSALLSMNVCSFHMYSVFSHHKMAVMPKHSSTKRLTKYIVYSYTISALIVAATVTSQYIITDGHSLGYGDHVCYLSSALLIGITFALPLGIILVLNGIMFVLAIRSIAKTSRIQNEVLSKGRHNLHVYIKLSTLTGLFWIVGILAEVCQVEALVYLSILLNGSQGVFIFVACVCNKRVLRLMVCSRMSSQSLSSEKIKTSRTKSTSLSGTK